MPGSRGRWCGCETDRGRGAAIDCGTNSIRNCLSPTSASPSSPAGAAARRRPSRRWHCVTSPGPDEDRPAGGGQWNERPAVHGPRGPDDTDALRGTTPNSSRSCPPTRWGMVATSATRDAENSQGVTRRVKEVRASPRGGHRARRGAAVSFTGRDRELAAGAVRARYRTYLVTIRGPGDRVA